jgi:hypothetical protein
MKGQILPNNIDISGIEKLCIRDGLLVPVPASYLKTYKPETLAMFGHKHGYYTIPTTELIEWLRRQINGRSAIEIGAGNGCIGRALGIPMTDSWLQADPEIMLLYRIQGQPSIKYPPDVIKMDAELAAVTYRPQVYIASWLTSKWVPGSNYGNMYGPDERMFVTEGATYIHIGNEGIHGLKPLLKNSKVSVTRYKFPWLFSRTMTHKDNVIYVFRLK